VHPFAREGVIELASSTEVSREEAAGNEELKERGVRFREKNLEGITCAGYPFFLWAFSWIRKTQTFFSFHS
jgi:hypothetical protein